MKIRAIIITICTAMALACLTTQGVGDDTGPIDLAGTYAAVINDTITRCLQKGQHLDSRSPNLRRAAIISCLKAGYLKAHKQDLIVYLANVMAVPSTGIIQYHLNKKFYETFRPHEIYALFRANQISSNWRASKYSAQDRDK